MRLLGVTLCFLVDCFPLALPLLCRLLHRCPGGRFWGDGMSAGMLVHSPAVPAHDRLRKTVLLVAVPSGLRSSQRLEKLRHPSWLVVSAEGLQEFLAGLVTKVLGLD